MVATHFAVNCESRKGSDQAGSKTLTQAESNRIAWQVTWTHVRDPGLLQQQQQQLGMGQDYVEGFQPLGVGGGDGFQHFGGERLLPYNTVQVQSATGFASPGFPMTGAGSIQYASLPAGLGGIGGSPPRYLPGGAGLGVGGAAVGITGGLGMPAGYQPYPGQGMAGLMSTPMGGMQRSC